MTDSPSTRTPNDMWHSAHVSSGQIVDGRFRVRKLVGHGAFGRVYEAFDQHLTRRVALKVVYTDGSPHHIERFRREVELIKKIEHGNVVRLYDFGETNDGMLYMTMEFVEGVSLDDEVERSSLPIERVLSITYQILDALVEAQKFGVIHRDLKPQNIILTEKGVRKDVVKVLDFGLARVFDGQASQMGRSGPLKGTPLYMAPEQIEEGVTGPFTDVYAIGLIVLEMLTGRTCYQGDNVAEVFAAKLGQELRMPPELPSPLRPVIQRAVARDPLLRYSSAISMYEELQRVASWDPTSGVTAVSRPTTIERMKALDPAFFDDEVQTQAKLKPHDKTTGAHEAVSRETQEVQSVEGLSDTLGPTDDPPLASVLKKTKRKKKKKKRSDD